MGMSLVGLSIGHLRRVIILSRWLFEQVSPYFIAAIPILWIWIWIFINDYNTVYPELWQENNTGYSLMVHVDYPVYLQPLHRDLPFLPEKKGINIGKIKLVYTPCDKKTM